MEPDQLKASLRALHAALEKTGSADPELRALLTELDADLHRLLAERGKPTEEGAGLNTRLEEMAADFDSRHPQLAPLLRELADNLAKVGI
ncbi:MAG: DUF4404 family protein [Xanthomonadales bacterium]|nr:DUF4404 family protein [Xanthomonadales bacterium]NIN58780.1 DUF4404 family protein [Xanthomonadales bacterium]NIN74048.1 DUF4404 family protein [Xanthomonadales bacterium]NIO13798.1 DUF4404 family protein [Xanthomonadales bacterium]NIP11173.1 DUF4404 family protein [Xanthomonadales bacterium]